MEEMSPALLAALVAPVRERGLKYRPGKNEADWPRRSREGAWIEIVAIMPRLARLKVSLP